MRTTDLKGRTVEVAWKAKPEKPFIGIVRQVTHEIGDGHFQIKVENEEGHIIPMATYHIEKVIYDYDEWLNNGGEG